MGFARLRFGERGDGSVPGEVPGLAPQGCGHRPGRSTERGRSGLCPGAAFSPHDRELFQPFLSPPPQSVPDQSEPPPQSRPLNACDATALLSGQSPGGEALMSVLGRGVGARRGHGAVVLEDGRQMELRTVSVESRHVLEFEEREIPAESTGQLHEGDSYIIRWTYTLHTPGGGP